MDVIEAAIDGVPLIVLDGDLDQSSKQVARAAVSEILHGAYPPQTLLLDLTECEFLDSGGLGVLLYALGELPGRRLARSYRGLRGREPSPDVHWVSRF